MPKLIGWREIIEASPYERDLLLDERLNILPGEADSCSNAFEAAKLIMDKAMGIGLKKYDALQQINTHNVAAVISSDWDSPSDVSRAVSRDITEMIKKGRQVDELEFPAIHYLRSDAFEAVTGKPLSVNAENAYDRWEVDFSEHDLIKGVKLPSVLGPIECFVIGAYCALGLYSTQNNVILNTGLKNREFVFGTLSDCVEGVFNIVTTKIDNEGKPPSNKNTKKTKHKLDCYIKSQAHRDFVEQYFSPYSGEGRKKTYAVPEGLRDDSMFSIPYESRMHFVAMGVLSSRPYVAKERNGAPVLRVKRKNESYVKSLKEICDEVGIVSRIRKESGSYVFLVPSDGIEDVMTREVPSEVIMPKVISKLPGMLQNPYQHRSLIEIGACFYSN